MFGSLSRQEATPDSDVDLLVQATEGTSTLDFLRFRQLIEKVLGREVAPVSHGGLKPTGSRGARLGASSSRSASASVNSTAATASCWFAVGDQCQPSSNLLGR